MKRTPGARDTYSLAELQQLSHKYLSSHQDYLNHKREDTLYKQRIQQMRNKGANQSEIDKCEQLRDQKNQEMNMTELDRDGYFKPDKIRWTVIKGLPC